MTDLTTILADEPSALAKLRAAGVLPATDPMEELAREVWPKAQEAYAFGNGAASAAAIIATALRSVARPTYTDEELREWWERIAYAAINGLNLKREGAAIAVLRELVEGKG